MKLYWNYNKGTKTTTKIKDIKEVISKILQIKKKHWEEEYKDKSNDGINNKQSLYALSHGTTKEKSTKL